MVINRVGVAIVESSVADALARIEEVERLGIHGAWMTVSGVRGLDALTIFAVAASRTQHVQLGTAIVTSWPRHPVIMAEQAAVVSQLAPGRFRLGVGPSHKATMEGVYGLNFYKPLSHLREYLYIVKELIREGAVDYDGMYYQAHIKQGHPVGNMPVMASALRKRSFEFCGAETDGAISWVCPGVYLRDVAIPAILEGASRVGRETPPPLIAHVPVCVHDDAEEVRLASRQQMANYPKAPSYVHMFSDAGFPEAANGLWSDRMLDSVVVSGNESIVEERLREWFAFGATELLVSPVLVGPDKEYSLQRTLQLVAKICQTL